MKTPRKSFRRWPLIVVAPAVIAAALCTVSPLAASEPAVDTLPPELVRLRDEGRLTVRALWAWKLMPESTVAMAMEFRTKGIDLISADRKTIVSWLEKSERGELDLTGAQRSFLTQVISRMDEGATPVAQTPPETRVAAVPGGDEEASDPEELIRKLTVTADGGDPAAKVRLALAVRSGADADPVRSVALLEEAAAAGDADAMALLADEYESGVLVPYDAQKARTLREEAAKAGSLLARWALEEE